MKVTRCPEKVDVQRGDPARGVVRCREFGSHAEHAYEVAGIGVSKKRNFDYVSPDLCQCRKMFDLILRHNDRAVVLLGQAPSSKGNKERPLTGRTLDYMTDVLGITRTRHFLHYARLNLNHDYSGKQGRSKADAFDLVEANATFDEIGRSVRGRQIVVFGRQAAKVFWSKPVEFFEWRNYLGNLVAVVPHTSGLNRWWNSSDNRLQANEFFKVLQETTS